MPIKKYIVFALGVVFILGVFWLTGCGTTGEYTRGEEPVEELSDIDELLGLADKKPDEDESIAEDDVLKLLGVTEEGESAAPESKVEEEMPSLDEAVQQLETKRASLDSEEGGSMGQGSEQEERVAATQRAEEKSGTQPSERVTPSWQSASFSDRYKEALQTYQRRDYRTAIQKFEALLATNSKHSLSDNCQYWIGESYYGLANYQQAIVAFEKVFAFANSNKDDAAQLKLGLCYMRLNDRQKAKGEFQKLIDDYPTSEYVSIAKRYISQIN